MRRSRPSRFVIPGTTADRIGFRLITAPILKSIVRPFVRRAGPLPDVAQHVKKPKTVGGKAFHRCRLPVVPVTAAPVAVSMVLADPVAPVAYRHRPGARRIFPFSFGRQAELLFRAAIEFLDELLHIVPCLLYTSDAADDTPCVDLGGRRMI